MADLSILHLEDDAADAELARLTLERDGLKCAIERVETERGFVAALEGGGIDLILSDQALPSFDGLSALAIARRIAPEVPFVFVSGAIGEDAAIDSLRSGAIDYVPKRDLKRLPAAVRRAVRERTERRERLRAEDQLRLRNSAIEAAVNAIMITDCRLPDNPIQYVNPAFERITGYAPADAIGRNPRFLLANDRDQPEVENIRKAMREHAEGRALLRNYRKDGSVFWNDLHVAPVRDRAGRCTHFVGVLNDITETRAYQEQLERQAKYDALTGLANRSLLRDRLDQALAHAQRYGRLVGVGFIDLDHFKIVNDSLGHAVGDLLLQAVAERLKTCVRDIDTLARLGGDEFVLILYDQAREEITANIMQRVLAEIARPFVIDGRELGVTCSIGFAVYPDDGDDPDGLLKNADTAMYRAKEQGRNTFQFYASEMHDRINERVLLETSLRHALERGEFALQFQPQFDLASGSLIGAEALVRWKHPELGMVPPARFIPVAEETDLIISIGEWVMRTACAHAMSWRSRGLSVGRVSVNASFQQFRRPGLVESVQRILRDTGLEPQRLEIELTESTVMRNPEETSETLARLKSLGVQLAIDDFGTGYSSLGYLKRFRVDRLKIDQSFVRDMTTHADDAGIVQAIVALAHSLDIRAIAEGVETAEQLEFLRARGCDEAQGYFLGRPESADRFAAQLAARAQTI